MPKIQTIRLELKYSKEIQDGEWKGIALGAEATVDIKETAREARQALQNILATELRLAWAESTRGEPLPFPRQGAQIGDEKIEEPPVDPSWCAVHETKMKMRTWGGYSHKVGDKWCQGKWCAIHNSPLYRNEKNGSVWYTHVHEDPHTGGREYCRGEQQRYPNAPPDEEWPEEEIPF